MSSNAAPSPVDQVTTGGCPYQAATQAIRGLRGAGITAKPQDVAAVEDGVRAAPELPPVGLWGNLPLLRRSPLDFFIYAQAHGEPVVQASFLGTRILVLTSPSAVHRVLVDNADNYAKRTRGYSRVRAFLGDGLVTSEGEAWKHHRRLANPSFRRDRVAGFAQTMADATRDLVDAWQAPDGPIQTGAPVGIVDAMSKLTLRIAGETLFSVDLSAESDVIGHNLEVAQAYFDAHMSDVFEWTDRLPTPGNLAFRRAVRDIDAVVCKLIAARRASGDFGDDLLGMLMEAAEADDADAGHGPRGLSDKDLRDEVVTMLMAGHETTAMTLSWALMLLSQHPDQARRVRAELAEVLGGRAPTMADLPRLPLLGRVIDETLRLYPSVWVLGRTAVEDDVIDGVAVPAGVDVYFAQWALHRDPGLWRNPEGFDPDRFAESPRTTPSGDRQPRHAYVPFSAGKRKCIGDRFALMEAAVVLGVLLQDVALELVPGQALTPKPQLTLRPEGPLMARVVATEPRCEAQEDADYGW